MKQKVGSFENINRFDKLSANLTKRRGKRPIFIKLKMRKQ
jgi:hypothetical protein